MQSDSLRELEEDAAATPRSAMDEWTTDEWTKEECATDEWATNEWTNDDGSPAAEFDDFGEFQDFSATSEPPLRAIDICDLNLEELEELFRSTFGISVSSSPSSCSPLSRPASPSAFNTKTTTKANTNIDANNGTSTAAATARMPSAESSSLLQWDLKEQRADALVTRVRAQHQQTRRALAEQAAAHVHSPLSEARRRALETDSPEPSVLHSSTSSVCSSTLSVCSLLLPPPTDPDQLVVNPRSGLITLPSSELVLTLKLPTPTLVAPPSSIYSAPSPSSSASSYSLTLSSSSSALSKGSASSSSASSSSTSSSSRTRLSWSPGANFSSSSSPSSSSRSPSLSSTSSSTRCAFPIVPDTPWGAVFPCEDLTHTEFDEFSELRS
eukprot:CAMPEP_0177661048 /NCGR_PEP_ID=MMETSP0447-20121125/18423_1 /TAXON_ID=0 /ORGANISM="Stygamoeba regulata, Strain BSH-02190019" /LENGTH=382 /DNA_ID=CAMNT_0019166269 /DNA_START=59 /DNA_END=1207 /DNA_ORIENTATION=-